MLLAFAAHIPAFNNSFQLSWDDGKFVVDNEFIRELSFSSVKKMFSLSLGIDYYHPFTTLAHAVVYKFWGLDPLPYHLLNVFFHLMNIWMVYKLVHYLANLTEVAILAAMIFALHPMHVESVAWVIELKDVMYAFFYLSSLLMYAKYARVGKLTYLFYCAILFVCSCLSKPAAVSLPVALLLLDYFIKGRIFFKDLLYKVPFFALSLFIALTTLKMQANVGALDMTPEFNSWQKPLLVSYSVMFYILKYFLPLNLSALHLYPSDQQALPLMFYLAPLGLIALIVILWKVKPLRKEILFGAAFFIVTTALMLQIVPAGMAIVSERYSYVSYIGISFIVSSLFFYYFNDHKRTGYIPVVISLLTVVLFASTWQRCKVWKDGVSLFTDVVAKNPKRDYPHYALGVAKGIKGDHNGALLSYNEAIAINPSNAEAYSNRGNAKMKIGGDVGSAILDYNKALELRPGYVNASFNRGLAREILKDVQGAEEDFYTTLKYDPGYTKAYFALGNMYGAMGKDSSAMVSFSRVLQAEPSSQEAYLKRGFSLYNLGQAQQACNDWEKARSLGNAEAAEYLSRYCK